MTDKTPRTRAELVAEGRLAVARLRESESEMADLIIAVSRTYPDRRQEFIELMSLDDESLMRVMRLVREREGAQADDR